jgi:GT2 family glycosyltransferase
MSAPSLTLLLMTYNQAPFLAEAIASALAQQGPPIEILVSDNGSTDDTPAVIARSLADYRGPHSLRQHRFAQNLGGPAAHVRAAAELCRGQWLVFQHGDDLSMPDRIAALRPTVADPALLCCYSDVEVIDAAGRRLKSAAQAAPAPADDAAAWFARVQAFALGASLAIDRRLLTLFPPLPDSVYEDQVLPFRAALAGRVRYIARPLVRYRLHGANTVSQSLTQGSVAALREAVARSTAKLEAVAASRRADLAHARQAWPERAAAFARLDAVIEASLAESQHQRAITLGPWYRRLAAALRPGRATSGRARLLALVRALAPGIELWHRRRRSRQDA